MLRAAPSVLHILRITVQYCSVRGVYGLMDREYSGGIIIKYFQSPPGYVKGHSKVREARITVAAN